MDEHVCGFREGYIMDGRVQFICLRFGFLSSRCCGEHSLSTRRRGVLSEPPLAGPSSSVVPQSGATGPFVTRFGDRNFINKGVFLVFRYGSCVIFLSWDELNRARDYPAFLW